MSELDEGALFDGSDKGLSCETFVRGVRRKALADSKDSDDVWTARYAASCLDGPALHWFEDLDDATQDNWKLLRKAILSRWRSGSAPANARLTPPTSPSILSSVTSTPSTRGIPTPVTALPRGASLSPSPLDGEYMTGRIKVSTEEGEHIGYLSRSREKDGDHPVTKRLSEAVVVHFIPSRTPHELFISDSPLGDKLCVTWNSKSDHESHTHGLTSALLLGKARWGSLSALIGFPGTTNMKSSSATYFGISWPSIWNVLIDGSITMSKPVNPKVQCTLTAAMFTDPTEWGGLAITSDYDEFLNEAEPYALCEVFFSFESI